MCLTLNLVFLYLSEDETGGGGAAIRPLEAAPPGISPSVHLYAKDRCQPTETKLT